MIPNAFLFFLFSFRYLKAEIFNYISLLLRFMLRPTKFYSYTAFELYSQIEPHIDFTFLGNDLWLNPFLSQLAKKEILRLRNTVHLFPNPSVLAFSLNTSLNYREIKYLYNSMKTT